MTEVGPLHRWLGRAVGLDLHRDFCQIAICEGGLTYSAGRVPMTPDGLESLVASLQSTDRVVMEVSGGAWEVARRLEPHVDRVVVVSPMTPGLRRRARRPTGSTPARWLTFCGRASSRRCGCLMSVPGCCGGGWRAGSSWCVPAPV